MADQTAIDAARSVIGKSETDDYVLSPAAHADLYRSSAPDLARALESSPCRAAAAEYERRDAEAGDAQTTFLAIAAKANAAMLLSASASGVLAATGGLAVPDVFLRAGQVILAILCVVAASLGRKWLHQIGAGKLLSRWMSFRAKAETQRLKYFELLTATGETAPARTLQLLKLEYFRRYELEMQLHYYEQRRREHEQDADRFLSMESNAILLALIGVGVAGILSAALGAEWSGLAAIGVVGTAYATFSGAKEAIRQSRRNAERYDRTAEMLRELQGKLDAVRRAVAAGNDAVLPAFVESVHEQLSLEHRQWLAEEEGRSAALQRLEKHLQDTHGGLEKPSES